MHFAFSDKQVAVLEGVCEEILEDDEWTPEAKKLAQSIFKQISLARGQPHEAMV